MPLAFLTRRSLLLAAASLAAAEYCDSGRGGVLVNPCASDHSDYCCDCACAICGPREYCLLVSAASSECGICHPDYDGPTACLLYTSPSPRDGLLSRMPSSA